MLYRQQVKDDGESRFRSLLTSHMVPKIIRRLTISLLFHARNLRYLYHQAARARIVYSVTSISHLVIHHQVVGQCSSIFVGVISTLILKSMTKKLRWWLPSIRLQQLRRPFFVIGRVRREMYYCMSQL